MSGEIAHQLSLSWSPPFTLPGETVTYSLLIQDLVTGHNESVGSLTDTQYTHQLTEAEALSCHQYLFSVFSVNDVGPSLSPSSAPPALHPSGYYILYTRHSVVATIMQRTKNSETKICMFVAPGRVEIKDAEVEFTRGLMIRLYLQVCCLQHVNIQIT